jgi:predicted metal-dependent hydrolase
MTAHLDLGDIVAEVVFKDIKHLHLSVYPPAGQVRISAPQRMSLETVRVFAISKLGWIKQQQQKLRAQERNTPREYLERESHYVWGRRYLLTIVEDHAPRSVELKHSRLVLRVRPATPEHRRQSLVEQWHREQLKQAVPPLLAQWQPRVGVTVERFFVQRMKTKWGSCNHQARTIRLNTELARKPRECLEYVVVHELAHLREPAHGPRFKALMDTLIPGWQTTRLILNQLPLPSPPPSLPAVPSSR